jgi:hypothetical protein
MDGHSSIRKIEKIMTRIEANNKNSLILTQLKEGKIKKKMKMSEREF